MSTETQQLEAAAEELTHAMARFVSALDAAGADAGTAIPAGLPGAVDQLAGRLGAIESFRT